MYTIYIHPDGKFHCEGRVQDGTERWIKDTLNEAVESMISHAKVLNGTKITKKNITFLKPKETKEIVWLETFPFKKDK